MENPLNQFEALSSKEKLSFKKEAMPPIAEILANDSPKMMVEMMPVCQEMMKSCNMEMHGMMRRWA